VPGSRAGTNACSTPDGSLPHGATRRRRLAGIPAIYLDCTHHRLSRIQLIPGCHATTAPACCGCCGAAESWRSRPTRRQSRAPAEPSSPIGNRNENRLDPAPIKASAASAPKIGFSPVGRFELQLAGHSAPPAGSIRGFPESDCSASRVIKPIQITNCLTADNLY
jgi:hypothetical protein